jgi:hypothetical protein
MVCLVEMGYRMNSVLVVRQNIPGDPIEPGSERRPFLEGSGVAQDPQEDLLSQVLTEEGLMCEVDEEPKDGPVVPFE